MFRFTRARVIAPVIALVCLAASSPALGQSDDDDLGVALSFSGGWAQLYTNDAFIEDEDGWYADAELSWPLWHGSPLHFGVSVNGAYYNVERTAIVEGLSPLPAQVTVDPGVFAIEPRLRLVMTTNRDGSGLYLAPRIGAGLLIYNYDTVAETTGLSHNLWRLEEDTNY